MASIEPVHYKLRDGREVILRAVTPQDAETHLEFRKKIPHESTHTMQYVGMEFPTVEATAERNRLQLLAPKTLLLGAFVDQRLIAALSFRPFEEGHPWVVHLARFGMMVLQEFWGYGIGRKLLEVQNEFADSVGVTRIEAMVRVKNEEGLRLYRRAGFQIEGIRREAAIINGEAVNEYFIAKLLNDPQAGWRPPVIETGRLILRPLELEDAPALFDYCKNPIVSEHTLWEPHRTLEDTSNFLKDYVFPSYASGTPEPFGITLKAKPDVVIGTVGSFWTSKPAKAMELAYALSDKHWGKGYMPEAARAVMEHCLREYNLKRVQARCVKENLPSSSVMRKIGMQYEGTLRAQIYRRGKYSDMDHYAFIAE